MTKKIFVTIKRDNWKKLKIKAIIEDKTLSELVDELIDEHLQVGKLNDS